MPFDWHCSSGRSAMRDAARAAAALASPSPGAFPKERGNGSFPRYGGTTSGRNGRTHNVVSARKPGTPSISSGSVFIFAGLPYMQKYNPLTTKTSTF